MKCKYSEWTYTNRDCFDDVCTLCTSGTLYCYEDKSCPDYVPDSPIKEEENIDGKVIYI